MSPSQIKELQHRLLGLVSDAPDLLAANAGDSGPLESMPSAVVYPKNTSDVQEAVRFVSEQAAAGEELSITARGNGQGTAGGSLAGGIAMVFPGHMDRIMRLTKDTVTVQPGMTLGALQQVLHTHDRFAPIDGPADATVGGLVSADAAGMRSLKYGAPSRWVKRLKVVLDDGSIMETGRLGRRELNRKKGLTNREGDICRGIDGLLQDHKSLVAQSARHAGGYCLARIKGREGSTDFGQLFTGAEGTLGIITEITLKTLPYESRPTVLAAGFDTWEAVGDALLRIKTLHPSAVVAVGPHALAGLRYQPSVIDGVLSRPHSRILVIAEFNNASYLVQNVVSRRAAAILRRYAQTCISTHEYADQEKIWQIYHWAVNGPRILREGRYRAIPGLEGAVVPTERVPELAAGIDDLLAKHNVQGAVWGAVGIGSLNLRPLFDISKSADRRKFVKLATDFFNLVISLDGSISTLGDGRLRTAFIEQQFGAEAAGLFAQVKTICDPNGMFNPGVKTGTTKKDLEKLMRHEFVIRKP